MDRISHLSRVALGVCSLMSDASERTSRRFVIILYAGVRKAGVLMTDGYDVYGQIAQAHELVHLGCWAHYHEHRFILSLIGFRRPHGCRQSHRTPHKVAVIKGTGGRRAVRLWASTPSCSLVRCQPSSRTLASPLASSAS